MPSLIAILFLKRSSIIWPQADNFKALRANFAVRFGHWPRSFPGRLSEDKVLCTWLSDPLISLPPLEANVELEEPLLLARLWL